VLETNRALYVNTVSIASQDAVCQKEYRTVADVQDHFAPFYKAASFINHIDFPINLTNWGSYGRLKEHLNTTFRLQTHFNQWYHMKQCSKLIQEHETLVGCSYQSILKLRDNAVVVEPMIIKPLTNPLVKECNRWDGINDKFLQTPRKFLQDLFEGPLQLALSANAGEAASTRLVSNVRNPEGVLLKAYENAGVKLDFDVKREIVVVDGRCEGTNANTNVRQWCLMPSVKDCHPLSLTEFSTYKVCTMDLGIAHDKNGKL